MFKGNSIPTLNSTITGWKNNDQTTCTSGPTHSVPNSCYLSAGVYTINVCCLSFSKSANYNIVYQTGLLYVNPKGSGAKKIVPTLFCVDTLIGHPSGYAYVANFKYTNTNSTPVYIPIGTSNTLSPAGIYAGTQPIVFNPGGGSFQIYFNGSTLTWTVKSYEGSTLSTMTASASSSSTRCASGARIYQGQVSSEKIITPGLFPNPTSGVINVSLEDQILEINDVQLFDMLGKELKVPAIKDKDGLILDCTSLQNGLYILKINAIDNKQTIRFVKE
jgi:hypothetical protein